MRFTAIAILLPSSLVSAATIGITRRAQTCTATMTGENQSGYSSGGGGAGTVINNNFFSVGTGKTGQSGGTGELCNASGPNISCPTIAASAYGGTFGTTCSGVWDYDNNSWVSCTCNKVPGAVQPGYIDGGTISEAFDNCIVVYDC